MILDSCEVVPADVHLAASRTYVAVQVEPYELLLEKLIACLVDKKTAGLPGSSFAHTITSMHIHAHPCSVFCGKAAP